MLNLATLMAWHQAAIRLKPRPRGFHLVTNEILAALPELSRFHVGVAHLFIQHTSASLSVNENADPDVRGDMARWFDHAVPENAPYFRQHTTEGPDDMPAHPRRCCWDVGHDPDPRRPPGARYLAGHLPRRAPRRRRQPHGARHAVWQ
jgi:secondary thiamine-phosphate synthase enzyme